MTAAVQPDVWDMLAAIDADPSADLIPTRRDDRVVVREAIARAAREHRGQVHISWARPYIPAGVAHHVIGAVFAGLHLSGHLVATTRTLPSGGGSGNASKLAKISRLVKPIDL